ncbi:hypothetical protein [Mesoterricola silvestris]|uniref:hypothetical protein n=1 Tax=Mesoterricola silvestris TaxID=2927979 RepID=UPI00292CB2F8|nr:hypothetical protein [Mesoterricola silvestris]
MASQVFLDGQTVPSASRPVCIYCNTPLPNGTHARSCPYYAGGKPAAGSSRKPGSDVKAALVGSLFQNLLTSLFASDAVGDQKEAAAQAAALAAARASEAQRNKDRIAQAEYLRMMQSYKQLDDGPGAAYKTLANTDLEFKSLDAETLAAGARAPFDTPSRGESVATTFFGDSMPLEDLRLLVNPGQDPRIVDLTKAQRLVGAKLKEDGPRLVALIRKVEEEGGSPIPLKAPDCAKLARFLKGSMEQRSQFQKTLQSAQEQLTTWETANRNALLNAAKDGLEFLSGQILDSLSKRGEAAARLQRIYDRKSGQMAKDGLDVVAIQAKIERLQKLSSSGQVADFVSSMNDRQAFTKDGLSALVAQLKASNTDLEGLFREPGLEDYFGGEAPELRVLLDITKIAASNEVLGKWVARKIPLFAGVELAINQTYNALDWYTSFKRVMEANEINGRVQEAAEAIQKNIDHAYMQLRDCPGSL